MQEELRNITITFRPHEAEWVRQALALASKHEEREDRARWLKRFAITLDSKIYKQLPPQPKFSVEYSWQNGDAAICYELVNTSLTYEGAVSLFNLVEAPAGKTVVIIDLETSEIIESK